MEGDALSSLRYHHDERDEILSTLITYHFTFVRLQVESNSYCPDI